MKRDQWTADLMKDPACFVLLAHIAFRARRGWDPNIHWLEMGEAFIGDLSSIWLKQTTYRRAKERLSKSKLATFKGTNKWTIAKLVSNTVFDINATDKGRTNEQANDEPSTSQARAKHEQEATNKNKEIISKKEEEKEIEKLFDQFWSAYPNKKGKGKARAKFMKVLKTVEFDDIMAGLEKYKLEIKAKNTEKSYIKHPATWLNGWHWDDEYDTPDIMDLDALPEMEFARICYLAQDVQKKYYKYMCKRYGAKAVVLASIKYNPTDLSPTRVEDLPQSFINLVEMDG